MSKETKRSDEELLRDGYVPNRRLFAYATGIAGQNMHYGLINGWLFYFINNILKINANAVGIITGVSRLWDSINDPIIGALIDRHTFKKTGEKLRPYLYYLPVIIGSISILMFTDWGFGEKTAMIYILACYLVWDIFYSMQDVALWGMLALSSPRSEERARVAQWTAIGVTLGGALPGLISTAKDIVVNSLGVNEKTFFIGCALLFGLGGQLLSMSAANMKESVKDEKDKKEGFFESIFVLRHNKTLILISLARILEYLKLSVPWQYFFESQVSYKIGSTEIGGGLAMTAYGGLAGAPGAFAQLAATKIVEKVGGMKKVLVLAQVSSVVLRIVCFFVGYNKLWKILVVALIMGLQSIPGSMVNIAHRSLMSDSIDYVEYKTGKRTEGITFSMQNFATKIGESFSLMISGKLLSLVGHNQHLAMNMQNATFMKWQWPMFILGPATGAILYLLVIVFLKDDKEEKKMIEQALKLKREKLVENSEKELSNI